MPSPYPSKSPAVSVVIPCYGQAEFLKLAVESVALQSFHDWEVVIVDDGSPDDTAAVAERLIAGLPGRAIRLLRQVNAGLAAARNAGMAASGGRYLLPLDSDDALDPVFLARTVAILEARSEVAIVGTDALLFGATQGIWVTEPEAPLSRLLGSNRLNYCSLFRREVWESVGGYNPNLTVGYEDWDLWIGAKEQGFEAAHLPEPLFLYRTKAESMLTKAKAWDKVLRARLLLNHPGLFDPATLAEARRLLEERPLPPPKENAFRARPPGRPPSARPAVPPPARVVTPVAAPPRRRSRASRDRLRILHTVEYYAPHVGGSELVVQQVSERLVRRGHDVTVATGFDSARRWKEHNGVRVEPFRVGGSMATGLEGPDLSRYAAFVKGWDGDVMLNYGASQWATDVAFTRVLAGPGDLVSVLAPVGFGPLGEDLLTCAKGHGRYFGDVLPMVLPRYDAVLYHSAGHKDARFARQLGLANGVVIPNAVAAEEFDAPPVVDFRAHLGIETPYLAICVANFFMAKGHRRVIDALAELRRTDLTTVLIGRDGPALEPVRQAARGLPGVRFLTTATREETVAAYHAADLFLFGSELECFPLVILEAMASRTAFVSTDCGNVRELPGGVVCAPAAMGREIGRLLDDGPARRALAAAGHAAWRERFTWDGVVDRYEALYRGL